MNSSSSLDVQLNFGLQLKDAMHHESPDTAVAVSVIGQ